MIGTVLSSLGRISAVSELAVRLHLVTHGNPVFNFTLLWTVGKSLSASLQICGPTENDHKKDQYVHEGALMRLMIRQSDSPKPSWICQEPTSKSVSGTLGLALWH